MRGVTGVDVWYCEVLFGLMAGVVTMTGELLTSSALSISTCNVFCRKGNGRNGWRRMCWKSGCYAGVKFGSN